MTRVARSRFGCYTCKIRKVKCDEARPSCQQCLRTGRKCEGLSLTIKHYHEQGRAGAPPTLAYVPQTFHNLECPQQTRSLDFYLHHAGPSLAGSLDGELWQSLLPRLSQHSLTIRLALLSVSKLFEHPLAGSWDDAAFTYDGEQQRAMAWYSESITRALRTSETCDEEPEVQLVSCLLFLCIEMQQIHVPNAIKLLEIGYRLLSKYISLKKQTQQPIPSWITLQIYPLFLRKTVLFWMVGHRLPPQWGSVVVQLLTALDKPMHSLEDARMQLHALLHRTMELAEQAKHADDATMQMLAPPYKDLLGRLDRWHQYMSNVAQESSLSKRDRSTYHALVCGHKVAYMWATAFFESDYAVNEHLSTCESVLSHAEEVLRLNDELSVSSRVPYSFELGIIPILQFVGEHCRSADLRGKAIDLLRRGPLQEGLFEAHLQIRGLEMLADFPNIPVGRAAHKAMYANREPAPLPLPRDYAVTSVPELPPTHPFLPLSPNISRAVWGCFFSNGAYTDERIVPSHDRRARYLTDPD